MIVFNLDDAIVMAKSFDEHLENLRQVLTRLQEANCTSEDFENPNDSVDCCVVGTRGISNSNSDKTGQPPTNDGIPFS